MYKTLRGKTYLIGYREIDSVSWYKGYTVITAKSGSEAMECYIESVEYSSSSGKDNIKVSVIAETCDTKSHREDFEMLANF